MYFLSGVCSRNIDYFKFESKGKILYMYVQEKSKNIWVYVGSFNSFAELKSIIEIGSDSINALKNLKKIILKASEVKVCQR